MNKITKTLTLLFFISGISLFVAYSSGCFTQKKEITPMHFSGSKAAISPSIKGAELGKRRLDSLELLTVDRVVIQAEIDSLSEIKFRMSSSKTSIANRLLEYIAISRRIHLLEDVLGRNILREAEELIADWEETLDSTERMERMRAFSSKSATTFDNKDFESLILRPFDPSFLPYVDSSKNSEKSTDSLPKPNNNQ